MIHSPLLTLTLLVGIATNAQEPLEEAAPPEDTPTGDPAPVGVTSDADPAPVVVTSEVGPSTQHVGVRVASELGGALAGGFVGGLAVVALSSYGCSNLSSTCVPVIVLGSAAIVGLTALGGWLPGKILGGRGSYWGALNGALIGGLVAFAVSAIPFTAFVAPVFVWTFPVIGAVVGLEWSHSERGRAIAPFLVRGGGGLSLVAEF